MDRIWKLLTHIRKGTLVERFRWGIKARGVRLVRQVSAEQARRRRSLWDQARAEGGSFELDVGAGARLLLDVGSRLAENICLHEFELNERRFVERYLHRGDVFIDVGANVGLYTVIAGKCVGRTGRVIDNIMSIYSRAGDICVLKLDTQGSEKWAMKGAQNSLSRFSGVIIECSLRPVYREEWLFTEALQQFLRFGFDLLHIEPVFIERSTSEVIQIDAHFWRRETR